MNFVYHNRTQKIAVKSRRTFQKLPKLPDDIDNLKTPSLKPVASIGSTARRASAPRREGGVQKDYSEGSTRVEQVKQDMESPQPMDCLLCGDVGYGKTEVAMRVAFI